MERKKNLFGKETCELPGLKIKHSLIGKLFHQGEEADCSLNIRKLLCSQKFPKSGCFLPWTNLSTLLLKILKSLFSECLKQTKSGHQMLQTQRGWCIDQRYQGSSTFRFRNETVPGRKPCHLRSETVVVLLISSSLGGIMSRFAGHKEVEEFSENEKIPITIARTDRVTNSLVQ